MRINFFFGLAALGNYIKIYLDSLLHNQTLIGFAGGVVMSCLITGFVLTKDPRHLPLMLRYSGAESFQRIHARNPQGSYTKPYIEFLNLYTQVRLLALVAIIAFFVMIGTVVVLTK